MMWQSRDAYLETQVMTASAPKLQLMLIDGAIRFAKQAKQTWHDADTGTACDCCIRAQEIVSQILAGLDHEVDPELIGKISSTYNYVFRSLTQANSQRDEAQLDDAIGVLTEEQTTWRMILEELAQRDDLPTDSGAELVTRHAPQPANPSANPSASPAEIPSAIPSNPPAARFDTQSIPPSPSFGVNPFPAADAPDSGSAGGFSFEA